MKKKIEEVGRVAMMTVIMGETARARNMGITIVRGRENRKEWAWNADIYRVRARVLRFFYLSLRCFD